MSNALLLRMEGKSPAIEVAVDIARRGVIAVLVGAGLGWFFWGTDGALSVLYAGAVVLVNFLLAGALLGWGGRVSFAMMAGAAMFGFFLRLGLIFAAVLLVKDAGWFEPVPLVGAAVRVRFPRLPGPQAEAQGLRLPRVRARGLTSHESS